jgi:hypothetical protein
MFEKFNVVCVTRRTIKDDFSSPILWHQNITGEAVLNTEKDTVLFQGCERPILYRRSGLDSMSLVIAVKVFPGTFDCLELYTDTPADGSKASPEEIRENAIRTMKRTS